MGERIPKIGSNNKKILKNRIRRTQRKHNGLVCSVYTTIRKTYMIQSSIQAHTKVQTNQTYM